MVDKKAVKIKERAERVRYMREHVLRLTREQFSKNSGISLNTLQNWERINIKGLTEEGANRLVAAYHDEGVNCTVEWLMYGVGEKPLCPYKSQEFNAAKSSEDVLIQEELQLFRKHNHNVTDTVITDDSMTPYFWPGDCVAGKRYIGDAITKVIGQPCIVELTIGIVLVRILELSEHASCYNLACANPGAMCNKGLKNVQLISAAPVLWMRRRVFQ